MYFYYIKDNWGRGERVIGRLNAEQKQGQLAIYKVRFLRGTCGWIMWWRHISEWVKESADFAGMIRIGGGMYRSAESALVCMMAAQAILYT